MKLFVFVAMVVFICDALASWNHWRHVELIGFTWLSRGLLALWALALLATP